MHQPWPHVSKNEEIMLAKKIETVHDFYHSYVRNFFVNNTLSFLD
jgi:hypothetical protein